MAVNPLIAMGVNQVDIASPLATLIQGRERNQANEIAAQDRQRNIARQDKADGRADELYAAEMTQFAESKATQQYMRDTLTLQGQLESQDAQGATRTLQGMQERFKGTQYAQGLDDDFSNLQSGNIDAVLNGVNSEISALERMGALKSKGGDQQDPSAVREYQFLQTLTPEQKNEYLTMKRANPAINLGDRSVIADPTNPAGAPLAEFNRGVSPDNDPALRGQQAAAVQAAEVAAIPGREAAQLQAKRDEELPQRTTAQQGKEKQQIFLNGLMDKAAEQATGFTTGFAGALTSKIPGSPGFDLVGTVDTIKANIGFDKLQDMRDNSPTGGALGQVSEFENKLLQAVLGNLSTSQSKDQFLENLELVREQVDRIVNGSRDQFDATFGNQSQGQSVNVFEQADAILKGL